MEPSRGNAIIAARLSRKHRNGPGIGIDTQDEFSREYARRENWNVVAVVADIKSGTVPPWERKNLREWVTQPDKLMLYDAVIAFKTDRVSRGDQEDFTRIEAWATTHGKRIIIVDGPQYPARDDADFWRWQAEKRVARQEWEQIRERLGRMQQALIARGKLVGTPCWGYEITGGEYDKTIVPTEICRQWAPPIFERCAEGWSLDQIARWLDAEGVPTQAQIKTAQQAAADDAGTVETAGAGSRWQPAVIGRLIRNTTYIGYRRSRSGRILLQCEPVISAGLFNRANESLAARPKRGPVITANRALCSAILFCPDGDSPMYRFHPRTRNVSYYRCTGRGPQRKGCGSNIRCEHVDSLVRAAMAELRKPVTKLVYVPGNDHSTELDDVQFRLKQLPAQGLSRAEEQAERERLWAEEDRLRSLPVEPGETRRVETGETYADWWQSMSCDTERNDWLRSLGVRIWAWKYDGSGISASMREVVRRSMDGHPGTQPLGKHMADGVYHVAKWDGSVMVNVVIPLTGLQRMAHLPKLPHSPRG
jgi:site-specific DNA recombinase